MRSIRRLLGPALLVAGVIALVSTTTTGAQKGRRAKHSRPDVAATARRAGPKKVTERQRENVQARIDLAMGIVNRFAAEAKARGLSEGWRQPVLETLLPLSVRALERVSQQAVSLQSLAASTAEAVAADDSNVFGDENADLVYTPITPCRFIDTRFYVDGAINGIRPFDLDLTGASYGSSGACNPTALLGANGDSVGAIAANLTIVSPVNAPGFLAVKPTGAAAVSSLLNWYESGPNVQVANAGIFQTADGVSNFVIQTSGSTHVIMDILGAFIEPEATALQRTVLENTVDIPNGDSGSSSSPPCPAGYALTGGGCGTGDIGHQLENSEPFDDEWFCYGNNKSGLESTLTAFAICSRVPGR